MDILEFIFCDVWHFLGVAFMLFILVWGIANM
jgi:hypothetical protein